MPNHDSSPCDIFPQQPYTPEDDDDDDDDMGEDSVLALTSVLNLTERKVGRILKTTDFTAIFTSPE